MNHLSVTETQIQKIKRMTMKNNLDNISRTKAYERFYKRNPEIRWALLAGIVSRNAGWNMTDLESTWFKEILEPSTRATIFAMYERSNWLIFQDAYPQLLLYEWKKKNQLVEFEQLKALNVSSFMQKEWQVFWDKRDEIRLCTALIINEQQLLEKEVMSRKTYSKKIFHTLRYQLEEHAHFSYVLLPTLEGSVYGQYVRNFANVGQRIKLGKRLAMLLFHPTIHTDILDFMYSIEHTGSRRDYERICKMESQNSSPILRWTYPIFSHPPAKGIDWSTNHKGVTSFFRRVKEKKPKEIRRWVHKKRVELYWLYKLSRL
ncbi:DUF2515 family protein [Alkalihalophilus lindianensis]|uniref:DUF2515 family protein n=1 Tax=Alkalihalophilus lindianensis TaxID=1630542 RepID=A0ABU3X6M3_9BACI|nr:DUF2515 family protein [Alkalihalophilus lindianensis]MDV2683514.1 DUF2515 family protein [Alkalihalophilus lindianensis]